MKLDVCSLGNAIVDIQFSITNEFEDELNNLKISKGSMTLVGQYQQDSMITKLLERQGKPLMACGGSVTNSIMAAANFGSKCHVACKVSNDEHGGFFLEDLTANRIDHSVIATNSNLSTGKCLVMVSEDAERTMCTYLGISNELAKEDIDVRAIRASKYLFIEGYLVASTSALEACHKAIKVAKKSNTKVAISLSAVFIADNFKTELQGLIDLGCDLLLCNESEAMAFTDKDDVEQSIKYLGQVSDQTLITMGPKGCMGFTKKGAFFVKGLKVKAIDTNGAGDMFAGAVLHLLSEGESLEIAAKFGCFAASKKVENSGPRLPPKEYKKIKLEF